MFQKIIYLFFLLFTIYSCEYVDGVFNKGMDRIDFTSIDAYPQFPSCDSLATLAFRKKCFENTAASLIQNDLEVHDFSSPKPIADAIIVHFDIDNKGHASLFELETSELVKESLPELEDVIRESIANFPVLKPAQKRNFNVGSRFMIPVYIVD